MSQSAQSHLPCRYFTTGGFFFFCVLLFFTECPRARVITCTSTSHLFAKKIPDEKKSGHPRELRSVVANQRQGRRRRWRRVQEVCDVRPPWIISRRAASARPHPRQGGDGRDARWRAGRSYRRGGRWVSVRLVPARCRRSRRRGPSSSAALGLGRRSRSGGVVVISRLRRDGGGGRRGWWWRHAPV